MGPGRWRVKALTLTQPWATLVAIRAKVIDTRGRSWGYTHRGELAIHASKTFPRGDRDLCYLQPFAGALGRAGFSAPCDLPTGAIVAVAELQDVLEIQGGARAGRKALMLSQARALPAPIPCRGALGVWTVPAEVEALVREALA